MVPDAFVMFTVISIGVPMRSQEVLIHEVNGSLSYMYIPAYAISMVLFTSYPQPVPPPLLLLVNTVMVVL